MKDILEKTIVSLSKKETINYKIHANKSNKHTNRKDIALFDIIKNNKKTDISNIKNNNKADTYLKLKNRLLDEIGTSLVQFYFHETATSYIYNELNLFDIFLKKSDWTIAHFHLQRVEKMANKIQDYEILDMVYNKFIKLSVRVISISPNEYIKKRESNEKKLKSMRLFDDAICAVSYELHRNRVLIKTPQKRIEILNGMIKELSLKKEFKENMIFKYKLFEAVSSVLIAQQEFVALESYCIKTYQEFLVKNYFNKDTHETKLQMLRFICSSLCANSKHVQALDYLKKYHTALSEHGAFLYNKHLFFYYNAMANNYSVLNPIKAIEVLLEAKHIEVIASHPSHLLYIYWNLAGAYFDSIKYKEALKYIIALKALESFVQLNNALKLHIELFEVILRIDQNQISYALKLMKQLSKDYKSQLILIEYQRDKAFVEILKKVLVGDRLILTKKNNTLITRFINTNYLNQSNNVVDYSKWLQGKMN